MAHIKFFLTYWDICSKSLIKAGLILLYRYSAALLPTLGIALSSCILDLISSKSSMLVPKLLDNFLQSWITLYRPKVESRLIPFRVFSTYLFIALTICFVSIVALSEYDAYSIASYSVSFARLDTVNATLVESDPNTDAIASS